MLSSLKKLPLLLDPSDRLRFGLLSVALLVMACLEVIGIASVLPFMQLAARPEAIESNPWLHWIYTTVGFSSHRTMLIALGVTALVLFAVSRSYSVFTTWLTYKCAWSLAHRLCMKLLNRYTAMPYEFFLTHNSSKFLKKVILDVNNFVTGVLLAGSHFVAYTLLSVFLFALLLAVQPKMAMAAFAVFAGTYIVLHFSQRSYLKRLGNERLAAIYARFRTFSDAISGIKALKTEGVSPFFVNRFDTASKHFSEITPKFHLASTSPRVAIELMAFGAILVTVLYWLAADNDLSQSLPTLSLFALASYRLLPALNKAYTGAAQLSHNIPVIDEVYLDMTRETLPQRIEQCTGVPLDFTDRIELHNLTYRYGTEQTDVLTGIDLTIRKHTRVALIGSTGSGKTTLLDILVGLLAPTEGSLAVDGVPITGHNLAAWRRRLAYVPQEVFLYDNTITRNIAFGIEDQQIDMEKIRSAARLAQIDAFIGSELPEGYNTVVGERGVRLSGGQRQRIGLARAFYRQPAVLLLDEATSALDGVTEEAVMSAVSHELPDLTVVMIAHRLSTVKYCQRILIMDRGRIVADGSYEELFASNEGFRQMVHVSS